MRIKTYPNRNTNKVLLEFDEFYTADAPVLVDAINVLAEEFNGRRMAYNMWEFESYARAEEFAFMYRLKYENNS